MQEYLFVGLEVMHSDSPTGGDGVCAEFPPACSSAYGPIRGKQMNRNRVGQKNQSVRN